MINPNSNYIFKFLGIFAYLNYLTPKSRKEILELLVVGLKRLEYRGYDSAGKSIYLILKLLSSFVKDNMYLRKLRYHSLDFKIKKRKKNKAATKIINFDRLYLIEKCRNEKIKFIERLSYLKSDFIHSLIHWYIIALYIRYIFMFYIKKTCNVCSLIIFFRTRK